MSDRSDMADLISKVGDWMTANEARSKLDLPEREDLEGEYGKPDDATPDDGGLFASEPEGPDRTLAEIPDKYMDGTGLSEDDFVPNADVRDVVADARDFIDEHGLPNPDNQQEGAARVNQLYDAAENDEPIHPDFWEEIKNFHARHRAQGNDECDQDSLPAEADEINQNEYDPCMFDPGYFSDKTWGGTPGMEQAERITGAIESTEGVELSGDTDFRNLEIGNDELANAPEWDRPLLEIHQRMWTDSDTRLLNFFESTTPEFVKNRIREAIMSGSVFSDIDDFDGTDLMQLREYMRETLTSDGWTIDGLADQLEQLDEITDAARAETIARTETASVLNTAREEGYEERGDDNRFYWSGNLDGRQTEACEWLINETNPNYGGDPVALGELRELVEEAPTHDDDMDDNLARPENWVVHPNERKTFVRHVE